MKLSLRVPLLTALSTMLLIAATAALVVGPSSGSPTRMAATPSQKPPAIDQFHAVVREPALHTGKLATEYTVYRPVGPSVDRELPVVVFGNGACRHTSNSALIGTHMSLAAHGFVVVAVGAVDGTHYDENGRPVPEVLTDGITWAEQENQRLGSPLWNRIDTERIAVAGHSCGGLEALVAGADPRVTTVLSLNSGFFADGRYGYGREELAKLHTPVLFLDGGPDDVAYENSRANYENVTVPAVRASNPAAGHSGFWYGLRDGETDASMREEAVAVMVNWLDFTLNDNDSARDYFFGDHCGLCRTEGWTEITTKNFSATGGWSR